MGDSISQLFSPKMLKTILIIVALNILFSYGMLYLTDFTLNNITVPTLFNSFLATSTIASVFISPISEELIFRGVFLNRLKLIVPTLFAVLISSVIFASLHSVGSIFSAFIFGICAAILYLKTDNIFVPILMHFLNNLLAETIRLWDSNNILFADGPVMIIMSILAILSFAVLVVWCVRELKILNNDKI